LQEDTLYRVKKMELQMERERGEREELLANILNFDQQPEDEDDALLASILTMIPRRDGPPSRPPR